MSLNPRPDEVRKSLPLVLTAVFAWVWVFARACIQSIVIDEADTYRVFVARPSPSHWEAAANNHVLNSLLMRLSVALFGASALSLRLPALLGAAIYIASCFVIVRRVSRSTILQWSLLACLVFSPFVMDYLVAARGYSLAVAFLMFAVAGPPSGAACPFRRIGPRRRIERPRSFPLALPSLFAPIFRSA